MTPFFMMVNTEPLTVMSTTVHQWPKHGPTQGPFAVYLSRGLWEPYGCAYGSPLCSDLMGSLGSPLTSWSPSHVLAFSIFLNSESLKPLGSDLRPLRATLNPNVMSPAWPQAPSPCGHLPCLYLHPNISEPSLLVVFLKSVKSNSRSYFSTLGGILDFCISPVFY